MKIFQFSKKHKMLTFLTILIFLIFILCLSLSPFIAVNIPHPNITQSCFSIALDKREMNTVNKIVIETANGKTEITDKSLIKKIVKRTMVAESSSFRAKFGENHLYLYSEDNLIRKMRQATGEKYAIIEVYEKDSNHLFPFQSVINEGVVIFSAELLEEIKRVLQADGNFYSSEY